ncbi:MAG: hypothetical protein GWP70_07285 [Proteobacteria bacterium]|nr:hypothetical protein [Pseudomonadota bacterium]
MNDPKKKRPTPQRLYSALFWQAFGAAAGMGIDKACISHTESVGYYDNVESNASAFGKSPRLLRQTLACCRRAGRLAARLAREDGETEILKEHFAEACNVIQKRIDTVRQKQTAQGFTARGGVCL